MAIKCPGSQKRTFTKVKDTLFYGADYYVVFKILEKLRKSIKILLKKGLFGQNGHFGGMLALNAHGGGAKQIPIRVNDEV